jgi:hypothetical protein
MDDKPITADNAYQFADNYSIWRDDSGPMVHHYGCEHNQQEAEAIAKWIYFNKGDKTLVVKNRPDQVEKAKALRLGREVPRYQLREEALREMGVWTDANPRRRRAAR